MQYYNNKAKRTLTIYFFIFIFLVMGIAGGGYMSFHNFEQEFRRQAERQISAIAELKANELAGWRKERLGDADFVYHNPAFAVLVERYFENPSDADARAQLITWLENYKVYDQYDRVRLLDTAGVEKLSIPAAAKAVESQIVIDAAASLQSGKITFGDFHRDTSVGGKIQISILVPIFMEESNSHPLGVLVLSINPQTYLYPFIQNWPINSASAETVLVRRDGEDVLFLNELRFEEDSALTLRFPLADTDTPAVKAVLGQTGIVEGEDYRGQPVLADVRAVPNSPWFLVSKVDTAEVYAPLRIRLWQTLLIIGLAIFVAGTGLIAIRRQQNILFYRTQAEASEALRVSEEKFRKAFVLSPDSININRLRDGLYVSVNNGFTKIMGYTPDEVLGKTSLELDIWVDPRDRKALVEGLKKNGEVVNLDARFRAKNGDIIQGLMSASMLELNGEPHLVNITRDITERKRAEDALRESEDKFKYLFDHSVIGNSITHLTGEMHVNQALCDMLGYSFQEMQSQKWPEITHPDDMELTQNAINELISGKKESARFVKRFIHKNGSIVWVDLSSSMRRDPQNKPLYLMSAVIDITERKHAEEELQESRALFRSLVESMPQNVFSKDLDGRFTFANQNYCTTEGKPLAEILGKTDFDLHPMELAQQYRIDDRHVIETGKIVEKVEVHQPLGGEMSYVQVTKALIYDAEGQVKGMLGIFWDITERKRAEETLRVTLAKYKTLFEFFPLGITIADAAGNILETNPIAEKLLSISQDEQLQRDIDSPAWRIVRPDGTPMPADEFASVRALKENRVVENVEMGILKPDNTVTWLSVTAAPLPVEEYGVVMTYGDITVRKQMEEALRKSEEKYRTLFNNSEVGMFRTRLDGSEVLEFNEKYLNIINYTFEELKDVPSTSLWADPRERDALVQLAKAEGHVTDFECSMLNKQGEARKCIMSVRLYDDTGILEGSIQDITERKQVEEALLASEERLRLAISAGRMGTWDRNFISGKLEWSLECKAMFGLAPEIEMTDERFEQALHPDDRLSTDLAIREALENQTDFNTEYRVIWPDGSSHWIAAQGHGYYDETGQAIHMTGVTFDITERKQVEEEIRKLNAELEQRVRERTAQLETTNKELEAFSYSVSHDLRAPLRGIDGWSQALLEDYHDKLDEQAQQYIERVRSETQRMGHLIDDMLQLSRLTRAEMVKEQVDLSALAQTIVERLKQDEPHRQVDFNIQAGLIAEGDSHLLEAVLANLLGNAFKFTSKRTDARIEFGQTELQGQPVFFVHDNGAGFDMAYSQKLFGAFQRMHRLTEFPGTGIGLATVQRVIHRHGGRVWAESEIDHGATFYFTLK